MFKLNNLKVKVVNVLGSPVDGELFYTVYNKGLQKSPDDVIQLQNGASIISMDEEVQMGAGIEIAISFKHEQYANTNLKVRIFSGTVFRWNHANTECTITNNDLVINVTVLRIRQVPLAIISKSLKTLVYAGIDKNVLPLLKKEGFSEQSLNQGIWNDPEATDQQYWGLSSFHSIRTIRTIKDSNGVPIDSAQADGWDRFFFEDKKIKLSDEGGFIWLEYGAVDSRLEKSPRFLLALWVPKRKEEKSVDFIIPFTHSPTAWNFPGTTFPYRKDYPYGINKADKITPGHPQHYVDIGHAYFFGTPNFSFHFVQQCIASGKPAVILCPVFPMDPAGDKLGQPFTNQQGMSRLLQEVLHFLLQMGYADHAGINFNEWQGKTGTSGLLVKKLSIEQIFREKKPAPLKLGNIVVCSHSSGVGFLTSIIQRSKLPSGVDYPFELYGANESLFTNAWKEAWDLDLSHKGLNIDDYIKTMMKWYGQGNRVYRLYRSQHTFGKISSFDAIKKLTPLKEKRVHGAAAAQYWYNAKDLSILFLNNAYCSTNLVYPDIYPKFLSPGEDWFRYHQIPMILGFGHACKLRLSS